MAQYAYDASGVLKGLDEVGSGTAKPVWQINDVYQGHLIQDETFGNGAKTSYSYDPNRRFLATIQTTLNNEQIQGLEYTHFNNGRVHTLSAAGTSPVEYGYDALNRLASVSTVSDVPTGTLYHYDDLGNITDRGTTTNTYIIDAPHLVDTVGDNSYFYDLNGNVKSRSGPDVPGGTQALTYTLFNLPKVITTGTSKTTQFDYSADEDRLVRRDVDVSTLHFVSDLYQRKFDTFDTTLEERFRLYAGDRQIGEIVRKDGTDKTLYFHTDHLGSTDTISDSTGAATTQHFEPFGAPIAPPNPEITRVGFTGQDQDVDLGFTDMKGRMYDPLAGRFASADPVMQAPFWSQGLNSYSYVFNDPINNTDPSGFESAAAWLASAAFTAVDVGLLCYGTGCGVGITGALSGGSDLGTTWFGGFPGAASPGRTYSGVAPTAAPAASGVGQGSSQAIGQNKGGVGPDLRLAQNMGDPRSGTNIPGNVPDARARPDVPPRLGPALPATTVIPRAIIELSERAGEWLARADALLNALAATMAEASPAAGLFATGDSVIVRATPTRPFPGWDGTKPPWTGLSMARKRSPWNF